MPTGTAAAFMMRPICFLAACEPALAARSPAFAVRSVVRFTARSLIDANQRGDLLARRRGPHGAVGACDKSHVGHVSRSLIFRVGSLRRRHSLRAIAASFVRFSRPAA